MKLKGIAKKKVLQDGTEVFYCPDCKGYKPKKDFPLWEAREVGGYCKEHHNKRQHKNAHSYYVNHKEEIRKQQNEYRNRIRATKKVKHPIVEKRDEPKVITSYEKYKQERDS